MNKDKIKAARALCAQIRRDIEVVERYEEWQGGCPTYGTPQKLLAVKRASDRIEEALAELDKAQQPGKVLTDEEIDGIALMAVPPGTTSHDVRIAGQSIEESAPEAVRVYVRGALRYARDNGYLAPAAVSSDERLWMNEWQRNMCKKSKGVLIRMIEEEREENDRLRNEAQAAGLTVEEVMEAIEDDIGSESMMRLFRARLTAAIEAKYAKP